jgi:mono/diheme cytochrome c family protein
MGNSLKFKVSSSRFKVWGSLLQTSNFKLSILCFLLFTFCFSCSSKPDSKRSESSTKFQQYIIQGEQLYEKNCSNCHQKNGAGLGLLYPPLNKSDFMDNHFEEVICIMRNGIEGELIVNGKSFNKQMKGITTLTDLEIAEIATYIFNTWERQHGIVEVQEASRILALCDSASIKQ